MIAIAGALLATSLAALATAGVALLAVRDGRDRIHFAGLAAGLAPLLVAGALAAGGASAAIVLKALLLALVMAGGSAVVSHGLLAAGGPRGPGEGR